MSSDRGVGIATAVDEEPERPAATAAPSRRWLLPVVSAVSALAGASVTALVLGYLQPGQEVPVAEPAPVATQEQQPTPEPEPEPEPSLQVDEVPVPETLAWAPPELDDPVTIEISEEERSFDLDPEQDYELVLPDEPLEAAGGVVVNGGNDVVLIGGEIRVPDVGEDSGGDVRALMLRNQTGTVHVEGVALTGDGLGEGINLDQREGAVVQLQNIRVDTVEGTQEGHHADVIQSWAGPAELRVDRLTGSTTYQGFFLLPQQFGDQPEPELFDLRRVDLSGVDGSGYLLWRDGLDWPVETTDVYVDPDDGTEDRERILWPRTDPTGSWEDVTVGSPPGGSFVPEGVAGVDYTSPGYGTDE